MDRISDYLYSHIESGKAPHARKLADDYVADDQPVSAEDVTPPMPKTFGDESVTTRRAVSETRYSSRLRS